MRHFQFLLTNLCVRVCAGERLSALTTVAAAPPAQQQGQDDGSALAELRESGYDTRALPTT